MIEVVYNIYYLEKEECRVICLCSLATFNQWHYPHLLKTTTQQSQNISLTSKHHYTKRKQRSHRRKRQDGPTQTAIGRFSKIISLLL